MKRFQAINHRKFFERWKDTLTGHRFNGETAGTGSRAQRAPARAVHRRFGARAGQGCRIQRRLPAHPVAAAARLQGDLHPRRQHGQDRPLYAGLQRRGIECLYHPFYFSVEDVFRKQPMPFDLVYLHRYSNASKYGGMVRQHFPQARIFYNVADLHFLRLERQAEVDNDAALRDKAEQMRRLELGAMSFVDCVIVHSTAEAELLRQSWRQTSRSR